MTRQLKSIDQTEYPNVINNIYILVNFSIESFPPLKSDIGWTMSSKNLYVEVLTQELRMCPCLETESLQM
jgi:hypothetical protein